MTRNPRVLVLGASGMLGHQVWRALSERGPALASVRTEAVDGPLARVLDPARTFTGVRAEDLPAVAGVLDESAAEVVVNCIGIVKQDAAAGDTGALTRVNAEFPHALARLTAERGARLVHVSTDCVFSGDRGGYTEDDVPDPVDAYGRSKLAGEPAGDGCVTLRTSIVGRELSSAKGLLEWFVGQNGGSVEGYRRAVFSGLASPVLAGVIGDLVAEHPELRGVWHVSAAAIDKLELLTLVRDAMGLDIELRPCDAPVVDRSLDSGRFRAATAWTPPSWPSMVRDLCEDRS